jgi:hypothetical protein
VFGINLTEAAREIPELLLSPWFLQIHKISEINQALIDDNSEND